MDFTKLIHLSHQAVLLSEDVFYGTQEQIDAEDAFFKEAKNLAEKMGLPETFEHHCETLHKATSDELIAFTMNFFLTHALHYQGENRVDLYESGNKLGVDKDGIFITDPFRSSCGRFLADPLKDYGLTSDQIEQFLSK